MKAIVYDRHGGPEVMRLEEVPAPDCHRKGIIVEVETISVEGGDLLDRSGNFAPLGDEPLILGRQAAGRVVAIGADVADFAINQRVVAIRPNGSHAQLFAAPARTAWPIPDGLHLDQAAAVPIAFGTAHDALFHYGGLQSGETVLVQAGASGVGLAAIQLARRAGVSLVITTGSSDGRLERLRDYGADHVINYRTTDVAAEVRRLTDGRGVDVVLDTVGGASLQGSLLAAARGGRIVAIGMASRQPVNVNLANLYANGLTLLGFKLDITGDRLRAAIGTILADCARGDLDVVIDSCFPLAQAALAHAHVESRAAFGRVLLKP